ncbi:hypothetical protein [Caudoviricetes sp.]|nr:hypothetical protein [Caudoviricetes sp.]
MVWNIKCSSLDEKVITWNFEPCVNGIYNHSYPKPFKGLCTPTIFLHF